MHGRIHGRERFYFLDFMVYYDFTISEGGALFLGFNGILWFYNFI